MCVCGMWCAYLEGHVDGAVGGVGVAGQQGQRAVEGGHRLVATIGRTHHLQTPRGLDTGGHIEGWGVRGGGHWEGKRGDRAS